MKEQKKQGLIVVYDPHNLLEFLWYYATHGKEYEWTALCLPNGYKGEYMGDYCERCGIFAKIVRAEDDFLAASAAKKAGIFLSMLGHAAVGGQERFIRRFLRRYGIETERFDRLVVMTDVGLISGMISALARHQDTVILEDGTGDYLERSFGQIKSCPTNFVAWEGLLLSWMGYANPGHIFPMRTSRYAEKYCSKPDQMRYREYREMKRLFDFERTDLALYQELVQRAFGRIDVEALERADLFFFTVPIEDYSAETARYVERIVGHVNELASDRPLRVVVKRHPRDAQKYAFGKNVEVLEIENSVPSEVLLPYTAGRKLIFFERCSTMLNLRGDSEIELLWLSDLAQSEAYKFGKYPSENELRAYMAMCGLNNYRIVEL